jgi:hypothetical protein
VRDEIGHAREAAWFDESSHLDRSHWTVECNPAKKYVLCNGKDSLVLKPLRPSDLAREHLFTTVNNSDADR